MNDRCPPGLVLAALGGAHPDWVEGYRWGWEDGEDVNPRTPGHLPRPFNIHRGRGMRWRGERRKGVYIVPYTGVFRFVKTECAKGYETGLAARLAHRSVKIPRWAQPIT